MNRCWMFKQSKGGGGNAASDNRITMRRTAAIGDVVAATVVADKLIDLGFKVTFQAHSSSHCTLRRHGRVTISEPNSPPNIDLDGAYENHPLRRTKPFWEIFLAKAQLQLNGRAIDLGRPINCTPRIYIPSEEKEGIRKHFENHARPWVFVCPRSHTFQARTVPDYIWHFAGQKMKGTKFWLGMYPAPGGFVDLHAQHLDNVIRWLAVADVLVTTDTGPMHIAAALRIPVVALGQSSSPELHLSDQNDYTVLWPEGNLDCLNCQKNVCPINYFQPPCQNFNPDKIASAVNTKLDGTGKVSAVIPIYKPDLNTLNRCLSLVEPQVDEVVIAAQGDSVIPSGIIATPKIKLVRTNKQKCGYSGNANHGVRHTNNEWLLMMNDDVFLRGDAVQRMKDCIRPDTGIVSNLLRYPDNTIYYCGKVRSPGVRGWGHANHRQHHPMFSGVTELENACGCCILTRRSAFYDVNALDEELPIFGQDDIYSLNIRKKGWKILFTPHSEGIHMEHQSLSKLPESIPGLLANANSTLERKLRRFWEHNINRVPADFSYV